MNINRLPEIVETLNKNKQSALVVSQPDGTTIITPLEKAPTYEQIKEGLNGGFMEICLAQPLEVICDEDGLRKGLEPNPYASAYINSIKNPQLGTFSIVGPVVFLVGVEVNRYGDYVLKV